MLSRPTLDRIVFCRHGETESNVGGWLAGSRDVALTDRGRAQASAAAAALLAQGPAIAAICSSPQRRALETAGIIGRALGLAVTAVPGLEERRWGALEGGAVPADLLREEVPEGESLSAFQARVAAALDGLAAPADGRPLLVVAHAGTWHALCCWMGIVPDTLWPPNAMPVTLDRVGRS